jgi:chemosensory pili system protein ChpA (sensor histidine kinase/response regulator)
MTVRLQGGEVVVALADDGAGLDLPRIEALARARGLLKADARPTERELIELIFLPGFSTADTVTELAGRGVGMDVVRAELAAVGGRIAAVSERGRGTRFTLHLPATLSLARVVLARTGAVRYAIPAPIVEQVRRVRAPQVPALLAAGEMDFAPVGKVPLRALAQLVGAEAHAQAAAQVPVVLLRAGDDRLAIVADDVSSAQEVVVKNVGPQVARLAGMIGATILGDGEVVLIVDPVQLLARAPQAAVPALVAPAAEPLAPLVMVVDDSLTVRRVSQRLLERAGYRVALAKDGVDGLRQLQDVVPDAILLDIEMPRMDGFDFARNVRSDARTRAVPIIVVTSRAADKHRGHALEAGANHFLGKPFDEDELLALLARYVGERTPA